MIKLVLISGLTGHTSTKDVASWTDILPHISTAKFDSVSVSYRPHVSFGNPVTVTVDYA